MNDQPAGEPTPQEFWESRYRERDAIWSGNPNGSLVAVVGRITPGTALDIGCGEGGDAVWLAEKGWKVTALDISQTALDRGAAAASARGLGPEISWIQADLATWTPDATYDLVAASFLQSPVHLPRAQVLRTAAQAVAHGGLFVVIAHASAPPWAHEAHEHHDQMLGSSELSTLVALDGAQWELEICEEHRRTAVSPEGEIAEIDDAVVVWRRL